MEELEFPFGFPGPEAASPEDRAERLVTLIAAAMADEGWYGRHRLIRVVCQPGDPDFELGFLELDDGAHPLESIIAVTAPADWWAVGLVTYGWAAKLEGDLDELRGSYYGRRPSQAPDRQRVRQVVLVTRDGSVASTASFEDGRVMDESGIGIVLDSLRRMLSLGTEPPAGGTEHLWSALWLGQIVGTHQATGRRLGFRRAVECHPAYRLLASGGDPADPKDVVETGAALSRSMAWSVVRGLAGEGKLEWALRIDPEVAKWCDDGLFSRLVLSETPPLGELLTLIRPAVAATTRREIIRALDAWGVLPETEPLVA